MILLITYWIVSYCTIVIVLFSDLENDNELRSINTQWGYGFIVFVMTVCVFVSPFVFPFVVYNRINNYLSK